MHFKGSDIVALHFFLPDEGDFSGGGDVNLALNGTASQISTNYGGVASSAIDNNTSGNYGDSTVTHTGTSNKD